MAIAYSDIPLRSSGKSEISDSEGGESKSKSSSESVPPPNAISSDCCANQTISPSATAELGDLSGVAVSISEKHEVVGEDGVGVSTLSGSMGAIAVSASWLAIAVSAIVVVGTRGLWLGDACTGIRGLSMGQALDVAFSSDGVESDGNMCGSSNVEPDRRAGPS